MSDPTEGIPAPPEAAPPAAPPAEETFPRSYVEELRRESQSHRQRAQQYDEVFGDYEDEDREAIFQLARMYKDDDPNVRSQLAQSFNLQLPPDETPQYMTKQDVEKYWAEQRNELEQQAAVSEVYNEAKQVDARYQPGTRDMVNLLWVAENMVSPNETNRLAAAHKLIEDERAKVIADYMATKTEQAAGVPLATPNGARLSTEESSSPKTFAEADKRAQARIAAARRGM